MANYGQFGGQLNLISIFLCYEITCGQLEPKSKALACIFDFGHSWPKSGQLWPIGASDQLNFPNPWRKPTAVNILSPSATFYDVRFSRYRHPMKTGYPVITGYRWLKIFQISLPGNRFDPTVIGIVNFLLQNKPNPQGTPFKIPQNDDSPWACPALFTLLSKQCDISA